MRIVSLVPSLTELLADLGLDEEVVGLTRFCVRPRGWKERKRIVGGTKDVKVEKVRALAPDLVLANREENTKEAVEAVSRFCPVLVTEVADLDDAVSMIRQVGERVERKERAEGLAAAVEAGFAGLPAFAPRSALYLIWRGPWMAAGGDTFIHAILETAGLVNVLGDRRRYPELDEEEMRRLRPELCLLSSEPYPFAEKHFALVEEVLPGSRSLVVDGELFSWYGSRLLRTPDYLRRLRARIDGL